MNSEERTPSVALSSADSWYLWSNDMLVRSVASAASVAASPTYLAN